MDAKTVSTIVFACTLVLFGSDLAGVSLVVVMMVSLLMTGTPLSRPGDCHVPMLCEAMPLTVFPRLLTAR